MSASWGVPVRRAVAPERVPVPEAPHEDMALLVARRFARALPGVPDAALDDFTGGPTSPLTADLEDVR